MNKKDIGLRLKEIRMSNHITQATLAAELGISRSAVANIECGLRMPKVEYIYKYQEIFNLKRGFLNGLYNKNNYVNKSCLDMTKLNCRGVKALYDYYCELMKNEEYVKM